MKISVIIPTVGRPDDLRTCLRAVAANTRLPDEVIIIEQGDIQKTTSVAEAFSETFPITVIFHHEKSLTQARNRGLAKSAGDIIVFVDDDVVIAPSYIKIAHDYFAAHPDVLGIVGRDTLHPRTSGPTSFIRRALSALFCGSSFFGASRIRRSGYNILQNFREREETVEWLSGNACWRRQVFDESFRYNENFIRWAVTEDALFSYRVHKKHPGSLRYIPELQFEHHVSETARLPSAQAIRMKIIYKYIFWKSEVYNNSPLNFLCWLWAQVGMFLQDSLKVRRIFVIREFICTYVYLARHYRNIDKDEADYNAWIVKRNKPKST
ncbi:MAG: glycosyltransferase [bacterium]|nr:glycosyltransferase [bacterium]